MGAIDVRLGQVELAAITQIFGEPTEDALKRLVFDPRLESTVTRLVRRIAARHVRPRCAGAKHPEHAVEHVSDFNVRPTALRRRSLQFLDGKAALERFPLLIADVHLSLRSED
jgi:hypothetical protein